MTLSGQNLWPVALGLVGLLSCRGDGKGRPDSELGQLVLAPKTEERVIDAAKASANADLALAALSQSHHRLAETLGSHKILATSSVRLRQGDEVLQDLQVETSISVDAEGHFSLQSDNTKDYGRHVIFDGSELFLRPRYGLYHARAQQEDDEARTIANEVYSEATEYLGLFADQIEVSQKPASPGAERPSLSFNIAKSPSRNDSLKLPPSCENEKKDQGESEVDCGGTSSCGLCQKKWRRTIQVETLKGSATLDEKSALPLQLQFEGSVSYQKEGKRYTMELEASRQVLDIGTVGAIASPAEDALVRIPARQRELADRNHLLHKIAPPARRSPLPGDMP